MGTGENSSACGPQVQPSCGRRHYAALLVVCYPPICAHWGTWRYTEKLLGREERGAVIHQLYSSQTICVVLIHREWVKWGAVQLDTQVTNVFCSLLSSFLSLGTSTDSFSTAVVVNGLWKGCFPCWTIELFQTSHGCVCCLSGSDVTCWWQKFLLFSFTLKSKHFLEVATKTVLWPSLAFSPSPPSGALVLSCSCCGVCPVCVRTMICGPPGAASGEVRAPGVGFSWAHFYLAVLEEGHLESAWFLFSPLQFICKRVWVPW